MTAEPAQRARGRPPGACILIAQSEGGGQEQAARMLHALLRARGVVPVEIVALSEAAEAASPPLRGVARLLKRRSVNLLYALCPFLLRGGAPGTVVLFQGLGFLLAPYLRARGYRVIAICDAPPRRMKGLAGLRERALLPSLRFASAVARTFDFASPYPGPVLPNPIPDFPQAPRAFSPGPVRRLLYVGRLAEEKGLRAFLGLARDVPELEFVVYGAGPLAPLAQAAAHTISNLRLAGYSRAWRAETEACLVGCCGVEACWTAGKEGLLNGMPVVFVPSVTGGPQVYPGYSDKAVQVESLARETVREALVRIEAAIGSEAGPVVRLWEENRPERIAATLEALVLAGEA